jgi:hypothetical protein
MRQAHYIFNKAELEGAVRDDIMDDSSATMEMVATQS